MDPVVVAVGRSASHSFSKPLALGIRLTAGQGVDGDARRGTTVKHRSRVARDPTQPTLRHVHLIHAELHEELRALGADRLGTRLRDRGLGEELLGHGVRVSALTRTKS
jgi:hypothetical protein